MTNREALESLMDKAENGYVDIEEVKFVFAEMQNNSDEDCISRAEAIKTMEFYHDDCAKTSEYTRLGFETAIEVVKSLPSVQSKYKKAIEDIKAEITDESRFCPYTEGLEKALEIIDKHLGKER